MKKWPTSTTINRALGKVNSRLDLQEQGRNDRKVKRLEERATLLEVECKSATCRADLIERKLKT